MSGSKYSAETAVKEHVLEGNPITRLEALILFGATNLTAIVRRLRNQGFMIESKRICFAAAIKRMEGQARVDPPKNLPIRDLQLTEYWISK